MVVLKRLDFCLHNILHNNVLHWGVLHLFMVLKCLNFSTGGIFLWFSTDYGPEMVDFYTMGGIFLH